MKSILIILCIIFFTKILNSQSSWNTTIISNNNLNGVHVNPNNLSEVIILIVGDNGEILRSTNFGQDWIKINSGTNGNLYSVTSNFSGSNYWICGSNGIILKSSDKGRTWVPQITGINTDLKSIFSQNDSVIYAVGKKGIFCKTHNAGLSWISSIISSEDLNSISSFLAVGNNGKILKTTNSGTSWNKLNSQTFNNLNFLYSNTVFGDSGIYLSVSPSGNIFRNPNFTNSNINSVIRDGLYFNACTSAGEIFRTYYGNWLNLSVNNSIKLNSISSLDDNQVWAVGEGGKLVYSSNASWLNSAKQLNVNFIRCWFENNGVFNNVGGASINSGFEWPKNSFKNARFISGVMIGAKVNNQILIDWCVYGGSEYLPGMTIDGVPGGNGDERFRIYNLFSNKAGIDRIQWPNSIFGNSDQGAPVYFDNQINQWKPLDYGDQTMFYSYTDSYVKSHTGWGGTTTPLYSDFRQLNFSFNELGAIGNTVYSEIKIINKSNSIWKDSYIGFWSDDDLGYAGDDKVSVDSLDNLIYTYNGNPSDPSYGSKPPSVGYKVIRSPFVYTGNMNDSFVICQGKKRLVKKGFKEVGFSSSSVFDGDTFLPNNYTQTYNVMKGFKVDGADYINPVTNKKTKFMFSGDPVQNSGWLMTYGGDVNYFLNLGPVDIFPGDTQIVVIAQVIAQGTNNLNSISLLREYSRIAKEKYDNCFVDIPGGSNNNIILPQTFNLYQNYPNPFNPSTKIKFDVYSNNITDLVNVKLKLYNSLGKLESVLLDKGFNPGTHIIDFNATNFASGIYFYTFESRNYSASRKMILLK